MKILIVSPMYQEIQNMIQQEQVTQEIRYMPDHELTQDALNWAEALVSFNLKSDFDYSHLKWVHSLGAGVDRFLYKKEWNESVLLTRTICSFGQRIAEYCLSYMLRDLQCHDQFQALQAKKVWLQSTPKMLSDLKVLVYGTGEIGQTVAKVFSGLGVEVFGVSLSGTAKDYFKEVITFVDHFARLPEMNVLINTMPLTEKTAGLFDGEIFREVMDIGFMNVGRGASVNEEALLEALEAGNVRYAVLDVFAEEPLPEGNPLWTHSKVHITPHISAVTTVEEGVACFLETLRNLEENQPLKNQVDVKRGY